MRKRKVQRPILPPKPPRRKERDEKAQRDFFPPIPARVEDLRGMRFGMLRVRAYAGMQGNRSCWCCECECGSLCRVPRNRLTGTTGSSKQISCGCRRADPEVRRAARRKVAPAKRRDIAAKARAGQKRHGTAYSMSVEDAARELRCEPGDIAKMYQDGDLKGVQRGGKVCLSAQEVRRWGKVQRRNSRHCRALEDV